jgi:hypothetical protein
MTRGVRLLPLAGTLLLGLAGCHSAPRLPAAPTAAPVSPTSARARFTDVTEASGLSFIQSHGGCGKVYFPEQLTGGCGLVDVDGDGDLDAFFPVPRPLGACPPDPTQRDRLLLNDGTGRFAPAPDGSVPAGGFSIGVAAGDYDRDGDQDLYIPGYRTGRLLRNDGTGRFQDVTAAAGFGKPGFGVSAAWGDYDQDGLLDLFVVNHLQYSPEADVPCVSPSGHRDYCLPSLYAGETDRLYRNLGGGRFQDVTASTGVAGAGGKGLGVAAADLDGDGWVDFFVANDMTANACFMNLQKGRFEDAATRAGIAVGPDGTYLSSMGIALGDVEEDGDLDLSITTFANEPFPLYRNDGQFFTDVGVETGVAAATRPSLGWGALFLDADNDGDLDLFYANGHIARYVKERYPEQTFEQANLLLLNDGAGRFAPDAAALPADDVRSHRGAAVGDVDGDGDLDVLVSSFNGRPTLLRNDSAPGAWLRLQLTDKQGGVSPIGAKVSVTVGGRTRVRSILGGGSYASQSEYALHFGLAGATAAEKVVVRWPDGQEQVLTQVPANQVLKLRQP